MKQLPAVVLLLVLSACSTKCAPAPAPRQPADSSPGVSALPVDAGSAPTANTRKPEIFVPPGDTRRTIACGVTRCRAGKEVCIPVPDGLKCVPKSPKLMDDFDYLYECDEGSDCPVGSVCCALHMGGGYCEPRVGNGPPLRCNEELCLPDAGAPCPAGEKCLSAEDGLPGYCETSPLRATCAPGKQCSAETGICVWTHATKSGKCGTLADTDALEEAHRAERVSFYQCTKPSDCASGMRCCTAASNARGTFCQPACELANSTFLCDNDAQCKRGMQEPFKRAKCVPASRDELFKDADYPPWVSVCRFE